MLILVLVAVTAFAHAGSGLATRPAAAGAVAGGFAAGGFAPTCAMTDARDVIGYCAAILLLCALGIVAGRWVRA